MKIIVEVEPADLLAAKWEVRDAMPDDSTNVQPAKTEGMNWEEAKAAMEGGACCERPCGDDAFDYDGEMIHRIDGERYQRWDRGLWFTLQNMPSTQDARSRRWRIVPDPSKPAEEAKPDLYPLTREQALDLLAEGKRVRHHGMDDGSYCTLDSRAEVVIKNRCDDVVNEFIEKSFLTATRWQVLD
jgi:hypothetical protein